ncbi:nucleotidyltransferase family protein [Aliiglaciecola sp. LCG003]|uniref:nucleotidyltransferase family protein n=1 Tax=Aliiglaciecola sp. LCG003 TaxID=3053655 RepID=UPI0025726380|nr:nucleotidyltransferase family protein [Aliiglaciecola sp. LCG003]WJG10599.1 nucleotidyltransferase family protein [Aliiglaciecola sp. LCG003]
MKVVLLAAGEGTRLRPITNTIPKCLVPINGVPLLDFWLNALAPAESVNQIYLNLHYLADKVVRHIVRNWNHLDNLYCWHEDNLLGTAGTLIRNVSQLTEDDVMVIHADNLSVFDMDDFIAAHRNRPKECEITMMLFATDTPQSCGIVEVDAHGVVTNMHEKVANPPGNLANGAVYIFSKQVIETLKCSAITDISTELLPSYFEKIFGWVNQTYHRDIGTPSSYTLAQQEIKRVLNKN